MSKNKKKTFAKVKINKNVAKPARRGGLGKGLDALLGPAAPAVSQETASVVAPAPVPAPAAEPVKDPAPAAEPAESGSTLFPLSTPDHIMHLPVDKVVPSPWQPRSTFDEESLRDLAESIKAHGVIDPILCRAKADGTYELIGGERRLRAAGLLGMTEIPARLIDAADHVAAELALVENLQREDLNVIEEAEGYRVLAEQFHLTQADIAERVGKARASVANSMRLLELSDEIQSMISTGVLSSGHAKVLLGVVDETERMILARQCLSEGLTVRSLEKRIARNQNKEERKQPVSDITPDNLRMLGEKFHARLGTTVRIQPSCTFGNGRHGHGRIEIDYFDNDDLTRLMEIFGVDVNEL